MNHAHRRSGPIAWTGLFLLATSTALAATPPFELKDGDRVVFLGGTFIEREQSSGYLETLLTSQFPDRNVTFRNLGWSGDTVWGEARARFGQAAEGFAHLKSHVEDLKPTVIFVNYGLNESFAGKAGLPAFEKGLNTLLDVLDKTGARIVMITPRMLENLGPPLPDPAKANERLADYVAVLRRAAENRRYRVVDLFDRPNNNGHGMDGVWTDNGMHFTDEGYRLVAIAIAMSLGLVENSSGPRLDPGGRILGTSASREPRPTIEAVRAVSGGLSFRGTLPHLAISYPTAINFQGNAPGTYAIKIDGLPVRSSQPRDQPLILYPEGGPDIEQAQKLRAAIIAKNELYFHRWRPQNETYLFGFRKHEQGNNAIEIPKFDPLVAAKEAEIARLRVPVPHTYEIIRKSGNP